MAQRTTTLQGTPTAQHTTTWLSFKRLWRIDAVVNIISGDLIAFFASPIGEWMGMNSEGMLLLRVFAILTSLYGLWQLWNARSGSISKTTYLMGVADMMLFAVIMFGALILDLELNDTGTAIMVIMGISAIAIADIWYFASRNA